MSVSVQAELSLRFIDLILAMGASVHISASCHVIITPAGNRVASQNGPTVALLVSASSDLAVPPLSWCAVAVAFFFRVDSSMVLH